MIEITNNIFNKIQELRELSKKIDGYFLICDNKTDIEVFTFCDEEIFKDHINQNSEYKKLKHLAYIFDGIYYPIPTTQDLDEGCGTFEIPL